MFQNPSDDELRAFFLRTHRLAVIGLSPQPARPSYRVSARMQGWGLTIVPVRPAVTEVLGQRAYGALADVPGVVDCVNVFRNADEVPAIVDECIRLNMPAIWIQQGIIAEAAAEKARAAGLFVVMDRCIMVEYARLMD